MYYDRRAQRAARRAYRRNRWGGRRGIYGFPWFLLILLIIFSHTFWSIIAGIVVAIILTAIFLRVFGAQGMMGGNYQQPPQQPYYQPPQQPYQQPQESSYQPYEQGYQPPPQETYQEGREQHPYPKQGDSYQQYDQPQAQYPEQMPPMQQQ